MALYQIVFLVGLINKHQLLREGNYRSNFSSFESFNKLRVHRGHENENVFCALEVSKTAVLPCGKNSKLNK